MHNKLNLIGHVFGRLTVLKENGRSKYKQILWLCKCECGCEKTIRGDALVSGITVSCGCYQSEQAGKSQRTHGRTHTPEYRAWAHMKERCNNPSEKRYADYGGRGISVCSRWENSFEAFLEDMGGRPSKKHSLDRYPDKNGDYTPSNCRWATIREQQSNIRSNRWVVYQGDTMIISELARRLKKDGSHVRKQVMAGKMPGVKLLAKSS